ncbi:hypothetical protein [Hyunsoonleella aestuarii]|uniref:Secreted protein n=1 Tax=Hyunsoonleella aestuarii TaxID=912802 RepID=A0ABP8E7D8_9FLAO|nr:hypothetical protein [Hyunsoonleella aestuarii]
MMTRLFSVLIICFLTAPLFSQANLNNYKYVIVPVKFDFLNENDKYQLNSLTKFLFNKYGFKAVLEGSEYPDDLMVNRCLALESDVLKEPGMFKTKLKIELKDCNDKVVFTSIIGESREKVYKTAYNLALRDAFQSVEALNYSYKPNENLIASADPSPKLKDNNKVVEEIQQLKAEIKNLKKEKVINVAKPEPKISEPLSIAKEVKKEPIKEVKVNKPFSEKLVSNVLYAQEIDNGFQLVDSSPKVVYKIKATGLNNTFLIEGKSAILYKKDDEWVLEYYSNNVLKQETLNIKF